ncbi:hypothetical protein Tco_1115299 [Tanacetum coccineum]
MKPRPVRVREATLFLQTGCLRVRRHKGRAIKFKEAPNRSMSRAERQFNGRRPSKRRAEEGGIHGGNLPPLLAAQLGRSENGQPLQSTLTSEYRGNQPLTNLRGNIPPNEEYSKEEVAEKMAETMEQYMSKTRADYGSGIARPKIEDKDSFELKGQFLKELRDNTFSGSDHEDANEHIEKVLEIVDLFHIPNITQDQVMLRAFPMTRCTKTSDGLAAIQAQLNSLRREIKKVNEKVYAAQVGCEQCKGPHYTKYFPLKEEGKTLEEAYYTQFGGPFQGGGYRAAASGFYQRKNENPSYQERRQYMEDTLRKFMSESAKQNEENSNMIKEI